MARASAYFSNMTEQGLHILLLYGSYVSHMKDIPWNFEKFEWWSEAAFWVFPFPYFCFWHRCWFLLSCLQPLPTLMKPYYSIHHIPPILWIYTKTSAGERMSFEIYAPKWTRKWSWLLGFASLVPCRCFAAAMMSCRSWMTRLCFCILGKIIRESGHIDYNFLVNLFTRQLYCYTSDTTGCFPVIASSPLSIGCSVAGLAFTCLLQLRRGKLLNRCIGAHEI